jgi:hypothetical protein
MARRTLNRRELRAEAEAAEARGITDQAQAAARPSPRARTESNERRPRPAPTARTRVVWAVCDAGGRTVATFDYPQKADAEALVAKLKAQGKGMHFVRSVKEPISAETERRSR